jgi:hypothetical protein
MTTSALIHSVSFADTMPGEIANNINSARFSIRSSLLSCATPLIIPQDELGKFGGRRVFCGGDSPDYSVRGTVFNWLWRARFFTWSSTRRISFSGR